MVLRDSIDQIRLDINNLKTNARVYVRTEDTRTRTIHCTLTDNGKIVDLSECILAEILIKRPDDSESDNEVVVLGNELQYTWRTTDLDVIGESRCQFVLTFSDASALTSPEFSLFVYQRDVSLQPAQGTNEYTSISQKVALASQYADQSENASAEANSVLENVQEMATEIDSTKTEVEALAAEAGEARDRCEIIYQNLPTQTLILGIEHNEAGYGDESRAAYEHISDETVHLTTDEKTYIDEMAAASAGDTSTPIYFDNGTPTACTDVVASKVGTDTVGSASVPVYMNGGVPTVCTTNTLPTKFSGTVIANTVDTGEIHINSATNSANGAFLNLRGKGYATDPGRFTLCARNDNGTKQLIGYPDGTLTWGGNNVLNNTSFSIGTIDDMATEDITWASGGTGGDRTVTIDVTGKTPICIVGILPGNNNFNIQRYFMQTNSTSGANEIVYRMSARLATTISSGSRVCRFYILYV